MAYSTSNPPSLISSGPIAGAGKQWVYRSTDLAASVDASGYITNAEDLGMEVGDLVIATDTDADPTVTTSHVVAAINADGSADLSDGFNISSTNTD